MDQLADRALDEAQPRTRKRSHSRRSTADVYIGTVASIELRDYHYRPDRMESHRIWAIEAGAFLREDELGSRHHGFDGYLQLSVRFLDEV